MEALLDRIEEVPFLLPLAIMCLRIVDVSIGTTRVILVIRGQRLGASVLGFFEVTIWLTAITAILRHTDNWVNVVAYGTGFALGNMIGMFIEKRMAIGQQVVRFISSTHGDEIVRTLRRTGYGVTEVVASGREGPVGFGLVIVARRRVPELIEAIAGIDPRAVVTVEDVRYSNVVEYFQPSGSMRLWNRLAKKK